MAERLHTFLLVAILMAATAGATIGFLALGPRGDVRPAVMVVRPGRAPVQWHGWQLIPPSDTGSCERDGHDACSDGQGNSQGDDDQSRDSDDDNELILI
jgi:hypothetical protein